MMDLLGNAAFVVLGWTALSLVIAAGWSRFMSRLRRDEQQVQRDLLGARRARRRKVRFTPAA